MWFRFINYLDIETFSENLKLIAIIINCRNDIQNSQYDFVRIELSNIESDIRNLELNYNLGVIWRKCGGIKIDNEDLWIFASSRLN